MDAPYAISNGSSDIIFCMSDILFSSWQPFNNLLIAKQSLWAILVH